MYSDELLLPWYCRTAGLLSGLRLFDAHTHLRGQDPDGSSLALPDLLGALRLTDAPAITFPMRDPHSYREANAAKIDAAAASDGRLVAFCRVDPAQDPIAELERRCADGGRAGRFFKCAR